MRIVQTEHGYTKIWLSSNDTYAWARNWPCCKLSGHRLFAEFEPNGDLVDFSIDGSHDEDIDTTEFNAIVADHLKNRNPNHPAIR